jgi:hypothetical protein
MFIITLLQTESQALYTLCFGRAIVQAVSRWLPATEARVRPWVSSIGICGGQSGAGAGFLRLLRFPMPVFISLNYPSSQSPGTGTIGHYGLHVGPR